MFEKGTGHGLISYEGCFCFCFWPWLTIASLWSKEVVSYSSLKRLQIRLSESLVCERLALNKAVFLPTLLAARLALARVHLFCRILLTVSRFSQHTPHSKSLPQFSLTPQPFVPSDALRVTVWPGLPALWPVIVLSLLMPPTHLLSSYILANVAAPFWYQHLY